MPNRIMIDTDNWSLVSDEVLAKCQLVAFYVDGEPGTPTPQQLSRFAGKQGVTITRKPGVRAKVADVETGTMTPEQAAGSLKDGLVETVYCQYSNRPSYATRIRNAGYDGPLTWWTGHWGMSGVDAGSVATQISSPTSKPPSSGHFDVSYVVPEGWPVATVVTPTKPKEITTVTNLDIPGTDLVEGPVEGADAKEELQAPIVDACYLPSGTGYYLLGADGGVFCFGDAQYWGSLPDLQDGVSYKPNPTGNPVPLKVEGGEKMGPLKEAAIAILASDDRGYGIVTGDGGVFSFGDFVYRGGV